MDVNGRANITAELDFRCNAIFANANNQYFEGTGFGVSDLLNSNNQLVTVIPETLSYTQDPYRLFRFIYFLSLDLKSATKPEFIEAQFARLFNTIQMLMNSIKQETNIDARIKLLETRAIQLEKLHLGLLKIIKENPTSGCNLLEYYGFLKVFYPSFIIESPATKLWMTKQFTELAHKIQTLHITGQAIARSFYAIIVAGMRTTAHDNVTVNQLITMNLFLLT